MAEDEVGSLGQETLKLLRALAVDATPSGHDADTDAAAGHVCTTTWCPVCQVVGYVKANPDVVEEVAAAAAHLARTVRDAFDAALGNTPDATDPSPRPHDDEAPA